MTKKAISCELNKSKCSPSPSLLEFATLETAAKVGRFHNSLPGYVPTPMVDLSLLAKRLGINQLFVKDESQRFDLNAFKVLGASYAIANHLAEMLEIGGDELAFDKIVAEQSKYKNISFVTATDGNHGRAVAWSAKLFGCKSVVYMPKGSSSARLEAIRELGAQASITLVNYDDTVIIAKQKAQEEGWVLLQDTAWAGYEEVPRQIMQGYFTLLAECLTQREDFWPTHVFLQAGVGSFAAAMVAYMCNFADRPTPEFIIVEPHGAACLYDSARLGADIPAIVTGDLRTIMAGLACGEPSYTAWPLLKATASAFLSCSDDIARKGMKVLGNPLTGDQRITSGESGAVTLGALFEILADPDYRQMKNALKLGTGSKVLLFSTEGDTDPEIYRDIVWR